MNNYKIPRTVSNLRHSEQGFASIVICLILIIVLALLTTGFAQLALREQQSTLADQLNNQAYYAAESGINDISNYINLNVSNTTNLNSLNSNNTCLNVGTIGVSPSIGNSTSGVSYTCAIVSINVPAKTAVIDVTGRARNVLKRLQANISWSSGTVQIVSLTSLSPVF